MIKTVRKDLADYLTNQLINISSLIKLKNHYMNENYIRQINSPQFSFHIRTLKPKPFFLEMVSFKLVKIGLISKHISNRMNFCHTVQVIFFLEKKKMSVNNHFNWYHFNHIDLLIPNSRNKIYNILFPFINNFCMYWNTKKNINIIKNDLESYIFEELI